MTNEIESEMKVRVSGTCMVLACQMKAQNMVSPVLLIDVRLELEVEILDAILPNRNWLGLGQFGGVSSRQGMMLYLYFTLHQGYQLPKILVFKANPGNPKTCRFQKISPGYPKVAFKFSIVCMKGKYCLVEHQLKETRCRYTSILNSYSPKIHIYRNIYTLFSNASPSQLFRFNANDVSSNYFIYIEWVMSDVMSDVLRLGRLFINFLH